MFLFKSRFSGAAALPTRSTIERGRAAVIEGANAAIAAAERLDAKALAGRGKTRGNHRVALTVAAVGITAVAATAAYVWWRRRNEANERGDEAASMDTPPYATWPAPVAPVDIATESATPEAFAPSASEPAPAPAPVAAWAATAWPAPAEAPGESETVVTEALAAEVAEEPEPAMPEPALEPSAVLEPVNEAAPVSELAPVSEYESMSEPEPVAAPIEAVSAPEIVEAIETPASEKAPSLPEPATAVAASAPEAPITAWGARAASWADAVATPRPAPTATPPGTDGVPAWLAPSSLRPAAPANAEPTVMPENQTDAMSSLREALLAPAPEEPAQTSSPEAQLTEEPTIAQARPEAEETRAAEPEPTRSELPASTLTQYTPAPAPSRPAPTDDDHAARPARPAAPSSPFGQRFVAPATRPSLPSRKVGLP